MVKKTNLNAFSVAVQNADVQFLRKVSRNTDSIGRSILEKISEINKKLKKSIGAGVSNIGETLRLLKVSQPLRKQLIPKIRNRHLRDTYNKVTEAIQQLLDDKPRGQAGQAEIIASFKKFQKLFSS